MTERGFLIIPDEIGQRKDLTPGHKLILSAIGRIQGHKASCYPSITYIANAVGMSDRQVQRVIKDLVLRKEVTRMFSSHKTSTYSAAWATARNLRRKWAIERSA